MNELPPSNVVAAWLDYWTDRGSTVSDICAQHGIPYNRIHRLWAQAGLTQRRTPHVRPSLAYPGERCAGFESFFCAECGMQPQCDDWHCDVCPWAPICACLHPEFRPRNWAKKLKAFQDVRARNTRALGHYAYAWERLIVAPQECEEN